MHPVILIAGASGGLGASTLAVATATVLSGGAPGVLVDAGFGSGGLDVTLAAEHAEGLRWGDLAEHEGEADGSALRAALPMGPVPVLAARGPRPGARTISDVVRALAREGPVVADLPAGRVAEPPWLGLADSVVLLVGLRPRWLRDAQTLGSALGGARGRTLLVTRGPRRSEGVGARVGEHLALPHVAHLADDPAVVRDEAGGRAPRVRGSVGQTARQLARALARRSAATDRDVPDALAHAVPGTEVG